MAYFTLAELKRNLNIEQEFTDDDLLLNSLMNVATLSVQNYCNLGLSGYTGTTAPVVVKQAAIMIASHLYINRTPVTYGSPIEIPYTFRFLLDPYKNFIIE